jgi:hypothetical protein
MSLNPMEEAFVKAGLASREELEKKERDRLKTQEDAKKKFDERSAKIKEERKNLNLSDGTLSPTQIENWRRVLVGMIGPYALLMPANEIQKFRDKMQKDVNDLEEERKRKNGKTPHEKD